HILAWIGVPLDQVDVASPDIRRTIVTFSASLLDQDGFDGMHIDAEPIPNDSRDFLTLLAEMRAAIKGGRMLSIATPGIYPLFPNAPWPPAGNLPLWSAAYYHAVAGAVDQIAAMPYDSGIHAAWLYRQWSRFETISLSQAVAGQPAQLLLGVPLSEEATQTHNPSSENLASGLA